MPVASLSNISLLLHMMAHKEKILEYQEVMKLYS